MSLKIHTEVEVLTWQRHEVTIPTQSVVRNTRTAVLSEIREAPNGMAVSDTYYWVTSARFDPGPGLHSIVRRWIRNDPVTDEPKFDRRINLPSGTPRRLMEMARDPDGNIWALDGHDTILKFIDGGNSWSIDSSAAITVPVESASGIAFDNSGALWVFNEGGQIVSYDLDTKQIKPESVWETGLTEQFGYSGLAISPEGDFWVGQRSTGAVIRFNGQTRRRLPSGQSFSLPSNGRQTDIAWSGFGLFSLQSDRGGFSNSRIQGKIFQDYLPIQGITLNPRFLGIGVLKDGNQGYFFQAVAGGIPGTIFRFLTPDRSRIKTEIFTAHLLTISNLDNEERDGYSNSLLSAPTVTETLPSLTSSITSLGGISVSIADPDIRRFFDGPDIQTTTQNPVRVYRTVCGKRSLIWSGFLDGISISATHQTTLNCRPILKKLDQLADFGFGDKLDRWNTNNFQMPIIACKLMPWSVQHADHSPVGTETHSFATGSPTVFNNRLDTTADVDIGRNFTDPVTFTRQGLLAYQSPSSYAVALMGAAREPYNVPTTPSASLLFVEPRLDKDIENANMLATEHLNVAKRPRYVTFNKTELTRSIVSIDEDTGRMTFERGILFAPTSDEAVAVGRFRPSHRNFETSLIPEGATIEARTFTAAPHYERFLIGMATLDLSGPFNSVAVKRGMIIIPFYPSGTPSNTVIYTRWGGASSTIGPFDYFSVFPSLKLGENYCNWTHIPVLLPSTVNALERQIIGAQAYPPPGNEAITRPIIRYKKIDYGNTIIWPPGGYFAYDDVPPEIPAHPLDSFFRTTQVSPVSRFTSSTVDNGYAKWVMYTPHGVSLTFFGRRHYLTFDNNDRNVYHEDETLVPEYYFFTQFATFVSYIDTDNVNGYDAQQIEIRRHSKIIESSQNAAGALLRSTREETLLSSKIHTIRLSTQDRRDAAKGTFLQNGQNPIPMARSKDMYSTEQSFEADQQLRVADLGINTPTDFNIHASTIKVDSSWQSQASRSLRVMPAHPPPSTFTSGGEILHPDSSVYKNNFPVIRAETQNNSGAFYVSSTYDETNEVGYWDTNRFLNTKAHVNASNNFYGYYHQHQAEGRGVSPYNFIHAIFKAIGLDPEWSLDARAFEEMTAKNPMQMLANSSMNYKALLDRACPGLGKSLRWNPNKNKVEIIDWLTALRGADRYIEVLFDENCILFQGSSYSAVSIPSSFTFENQDMLKGVNTLEGFDDANKLLSRYVRITSGLFIQGKSVTIPTATWHEDAAEGLELYNRIAEILSYRVSIISFSVGSEVLLGYGELGSLSVGKWVRLVSPAFVEGVADVFIVETVASELSTQFKAYKFQGVGITDLADNDVAVGSPPDTIDDIPGDDSPPDDETLSEGSKENRIYY